MLGLAILFAVALAILLALLAGLLAREMTRPPRHAAGYAIGRGMAVDPSESGLAFESWILDRPDGAALPVWDVRNPRSRAADPASDDRHPLPFSTAVFVHGWGHGRVDALARIGDFLPWFDRLVFYDLRGHGESSGCLGRLGDGEDDDLLALLDRLGSEGPVVLIGHSMGAVIAIAAALKRTRGVSGGGEVAGVIAYGPYCEFHRSLIGRLRVSGFPARPITDLALALLRLRGVRPRSLREDDLRNLQTPLLVVHGSDDMISPPEHGRRIAAAAPHATWRETPEAGHMDAHSTNAEAHAQAVGAFLERCGLSPISRPA